MNNTNDNLYDVIVIGGGYAAGDVCIKPLRQIVTATGDGALAATELEKHASQMQAKTGIRPNPPTTRVNSSYGHEFTSFVLGLYNAAGPGQPIDDDTAKSIKELKNQIDAKILVTLACTMCPDLVVATQKIASLNSYITAEVFDIRHFENLKEKYKVMSVPCLIINDEHVYFGKKNIDELLKIIEDI